MKSFIIAGLLITALLFSCAASGDVISDDTVKQKVNIERVIEKRAKLIEEYKELLKRLYASDLWQDIKLLRIQIEVMNEIIAKYEEMQEE